MAKKEYILSNLLATKLLPLFYNDRAHTCIEILKSLYNGGIRLVEYTNRGDQALINFREIRNYAKSNLPGLLLGIGTIKNETDAKLFIDAGAEFVVCPSIDPRVGMLCKEEGKLWIPGTMTATEIALAEQCEAKMVKVFPGNLLGPGYIDSIRDIFPKLKFMVTGGVDMDMENLNGWFRSGVSAVGMGSKLISKEIIQKQDYTTLTENAAMALQMVKDCADI